ncbi:2-hydroxyacid dehydrogenase [Sphingomonas sp. AP4-R1]|uniref:2-hydroxyacid dehydrogenase n=1 Tax=Sphingomonas sp. AP4-R1 TaxID=2735134 RepID=UPI001493D943|nr:2-hydroxyacid dehydrogenase [Sphingomonas sp. AP4-R1]QJU58949.1 2-hydroxyacid dehydrogenase [Sphingomonas sp. AP4-R1]
MADAFPILMLIERPSQWLLGGLDDRYDLRHAPGPGITVAITGGGEGIDATTIDACPDLKLIAVCAVGYDKVDVAHAHARGIAVTNTPDVLTDDVADLALALMLSVSRKVALHDHYVREGRWVREGTPPLTRKLTGQKIGILGYGRIGHAIAERVKPIAGEIAYYARSEKPDAEWRYIGDPVALADWADMLVVAVAGGKGTAGLVSREVIAALGPEGVLINIARGSVVDEPALVDALVSGRLGGAGLDVFADEPNVPEALLGLESVVLLPHQGSATRETRAAMAQLVLDNVEAFVAGKPLLTPVPAA